MTAKRGQKGGRGGGWFSSHLVTQLWSKKTEFTSGQETFPECPKGAISRVVLQGPVKRMTGSEKDTSCLRQTPGGPDTKRQVQPEKWRPHHRYFNRSQSRAITEAPEMFRKLYANLRHICQVLGKQISNYISTQGHATISVL